MKVNDVPIGSFAHWFRSELLRREMTQADFARLSGFKTGVVNHWSKGARIPSSESVDRIADVLHLDVDLVLTKAGHRPATFVVDPESAEGQLVPIIRQIDWTDRDLIGIKAQLEFLASKQPRR